MIPKSGENKINFNSASVGMGYNSPRALTSHGGRMCLKPKNAESHAGDW